MTIYEGPQHVQKPGLRYTACSRCGKVWNTDRFMARRAEQYICPYCAHRERIKRNEKDMDSAAYSVAGSDVGC